MLCNAQEQTYSIVVALWLICSLSGELQMPGKTCFPLTRGKRGLPKSNKTYGKKQGQRPISDRLSRLHKDKGLGTDFLYKIHSTYYAMYCTTIKFFSQVGVKWNTEFYNYQMPQISMNPNEEYAHRHTRDRHIATVTLLVYDKLFGMKGPQLVVA